MSVEILPPYVYELIVAVQQYEEEHGSGSTCLHEALYRVPEHQRDLAHVIRAYRRYLEAFPPSPPGSEVHP